MKLFRTGSVALVEDCQRFLNFLPASYQVDVRTVKFLQKYKALENRICSLFGQEADRQLRNLCTVYNMPSGSSACKIIKQIRNKFFKSLRQRIINEVFMIVSSHLASVFLLLLVSYFYFFVIFSVSIFFVYSFLLLY